MTQKQKVSSDARTDVMLSADSIPPKPSKSGVQSQMDYNIVPQANTMTELSSKLSNLNDATKDSLLAAP